jgi:hypothetical protein
MGTTAIGKGTKNDKRLVARQGVEALLAGRDHVVGGNRATKLQAQLHRFLTEPVKARMQGAKAKVSA